MVTNLRLMYSYCLNIKYVKENVVGGFFFAAYEGEKGS